MKSFLKSLVITTLSLLLVFFLLIIIAATYIASSTTKNEVVKVDPNSVLKIALNQPIADRTAERYSNLSVFNIDTDTPLGLNDILDNIEKAKNDDHIKGIYLDLYLTPIGLAQLEEIRNALIDFKTSGKFIIAYGEIITQKSYYLASIADKIYLNPKGYMEIKGYSSHLSFYKNTLDRLGLEAEVFYAGNFKSATEPIRYTKMSDYNRVQTRALLNDFFDNYIENVAQARKMPVPELKNIIDNLLVRKADDALKYKIVDGLMYIDQVTDDLKQRMGLETNDKLSVINIDKYTDVPNPKPNKEGNQEIALIYAEGDIVSGKGEETNIGSDKFVETIQEIRKNDNVKAIVLRINSPGGSALASDIIWRELELAKQQKIPIIVSMGNVAASGGYYIACNADTIFAEQNTITGSIGVFGLLLEGNKFFEDKLGITFDTVKTTKFSDFPASFLVDRQLTDAEKSIIQQGVNDTYEDFTKRVADGRKLPIDSVKAIAQGRVWTGEQAQKKGLVDVIGNLEDAINLAAKKAKLQNGDYFIQDYPKQISAWQRVLNEISGEKTQLALKKELGMLYPYYKDFKSIISLQGVQMKMPCELTVE